MKYIAPTLTILLMPTVTLAQDKPAGLRTQAQATSGTTDVAAEGFKEAANPVDAPSDDKTALTLSAGGLLTSGNSRSLSATGAGLFAWRRSNNQVSAQVSANYGRAAADPESPVETTAQNYQGRLRYDRFVGKRLALFLSVSGRHDRFQGLDMRLNIDPGISYHLLAEDTQKLWFDLGYDLQLDLRREEALDAVEADSGLRPDDSQVRHNARAFTGYELQPRKGVTFATGLEYLQGLSPYEDEDTEKVNWRLNWDAALTAQVSEQFSIATTVAIKFDNNPLPGLQTTDTVTAVSLVYNLL